MNELEMHDSLRRAALQTLLWVTAFGAGLFVYYNLQRGAVSLALLEVGLGIGCALLVPVVRRTRYLRHWTLVYLVALYGTIIFALLTPDNSGTIFVWTLLIPILSHLLLGRRMGLAVSLVFMVAANIIYLLRYTQGGGVNDILAFANIAVCSGAVLAFSHVYERTRERLERALLHVAATDPLTGLPNRRTFDGLIEREEARAARDGGCLSMLLVDLDHFKHINDRYGHDAGDAVLVDVAQRLAQRLRKIDSVCRLGGEEFAVILPGTNRQTAADVAEQLRQAIAQPPVMHGDEHIAVSASFGVAELGVDANDAQGLCRVADQRLYQAKAAGRDRVSASSEDAATDAPRPRSAKIIRLRPASERRPA